MQITLQIENVDRLQTGGQVSYTCSDRGFDIGRHEHLDWSLPDPQRVISGKHCEIRFEDNTFVLYDVSTNGTFLNGSPNRMDKPQALKSGDRFMVGDYIISVTLEGGSAAQATPLASPSAGQWASPFESASAPTQESGWQMPPASSQDPSYPMPAADNPWGPPGPGMEGRHAPPSHAPGVGTPADDVWSQQGHGWGNADPALYSPQPDTPIQQPPRPAQADPLDRLAPQPDLQPAHPPHAASPPAGPSPFGKEENAPPSPFAGGGADERSTAPLFGMPDLAPEAPQPAAPETQTPQGPVQSDENPAGESVFPASPVQAEPIAETGQPAPQESQVVPQPASETQTAAPALQPEPPAADPAPVVPAAQAEPADTKDIPRGPPAAVPQAGAVDFLSAFAEGAGIPVSALDSREPEELAREIGEILSGITGDLMGLLAARSQVKAMTRNANRTMISRSGNNALKFSPTPQMALQTMLSKSAEENGYLPIRKAMAGAFKDIQKHHVWTYSAMQKAAARFESTLSPKAIESEGLVQKSTFGNVKAKQWEKLEERWSSLVSAHDDGLVGVFTQYFTENYEELSRADEGDAPGF